jgi:hypothetical protein
MESSPRGMLEGKRYLRDRKSAIGPAAQATFVVSEKMEEEWERY